MRWYTPTDKGFHVHVHASPRASKNEIVGQHGHRLKIKVTAPPSDGKANEKILELLADELKCRSRDIQLHSGHKGKRKTVAIDNVTEERIRTLVHE